MLSSARIPSTNGPNALYWTNACLHSDKPALCNFTPRRSALSPQASFWSGSYTTGDSWWPQSCGPSNYSCKSAAWASAPRIFLFGSPQSIVPFCQGHPLAIEVYPECPGIFLYVCCLPTINCFSLGALKVLHHNVLALCESCSSSRAGLRSQDG